VEGLAGVFRGGWGGVLVGLVVLRGESGGEGGGGVQEGRREIYSTGSFWTHGIKKLQHSVGVCGRKHYSAV